MQRTAEAVPCPRRMLAVIWRYSDRHGSHSRLIVISHVCGIAKPLKPLPPKIHVGFESATINSYCNFSGLGAQIPKAIVFLLTFHIQSPSDMITYLN